MFQDHIENTCLSFQLCVFPNIFNYCCDFPVWIINQINTSIKIIQQEHGSDSLRTRDLNNGCSFFNDYHFSAAWRWSGPVVKGSVRSSFSDDRWWWRVSNNREKSSTVTSIDVSCDMSTTQVIKRITSWTTLTIVCTPELRLEYDIGRVYVVVLT